MKESNNHSSCHSTASPESKKSRSGFYVKGVSGMNILSAVVIVLFPKCPMCWAAYASLFSAVGLEQLAYDPKWKYIALSVLLAGSLFVVYYHVKHRSWLNLGLYGSAMVVLAAGYVFELPGNWWLYLAAALIFFSTFTFLSRFSLGRKRQIT